MSNNYLSDITDKASQAFDNLFELTLKDVLPVLDERKLEKNRDNISLVLAELMVKDEIISEEINKYITVFSSILERLLGYLCTQEFRWFPDKKNSKKLRELLVAKIKVCKEKELEKPPESLIEIFEILDIPITNQLNLVLELIDERFIQALAINKNEYFSVLRNLKNEIEDLLYEE